MRNISKPKRSVNLFIPGLIILGFILGVIATNYLNWFNTNFSLRSPIVLQSLVVKKGLAIATPSATPSATPTSSPSSQPTPPGTVSKE